MSDDDNFFADTVLPEPPRQHGLTDDALAPRFGDGPIPADLGRFNVSAFVWGGWWSLAYGLWSRLLVQLGLAVVNGVTFTFIAALVPGWPRSPLQAAPQVLFYFVIIGVNAWFASTANVRAWDNATRRLAGASGLTFAKSARGSVDSFRRVQKTWMRLGLALYVLLLLTPVLIPARTYHESLTLGGSGIEAIAVLVVGVVAWFLLRREKV